MSSVVNLSSHEICPKCDGEGLLDDDCAKCNGYGVVYTPTEDICEECDGTGKVICVECARKGVIEKWGYE